MTQVHWPNTVSSIVRVDMCRLFLLESKEWTLSWGGSQWMAVKSFQFCPTIKIKNAKKSSQVGGSRSITHRMSPSGWDLCLALKKTRWWDEGVFSHRLSDSLIFLGRRDQSRGAADVQTCSVATKLYFCLSQFTWSTNWCQLFKSVSRSQISLEFYLLSSPDLSLLYVLFFLMGVNRMPECKSKWLFFSFESFQREPFHPKGLVENLSYFVNFKPITWFSLCLWTICKTEIKAVSVEWEEKLLWPVDRSMVWWTAHRKESPVSGYPTWTRKFPSNTFNSSQQATACDTI